jgi:hypothetical protein
MRLRSPGEWRDWIVFAAAMAYGLLVFQAGFRLTGEVLPIIGLLLIGGFAFGCSAPRRAWLWGVAIGIGTHLLPEVPLSAEHIQHEAPSRPLPLPFGLTGSQAAEWIASLLIIMAFPLVAAIAGWAARRLLERVA